MGGLFAVDGPMARFLNRIADLVLLNILTGIGLVPVICLLMILTGYLPLSVWTVLISLFSVCGGCFVTAMHYCLLKMVRDEEGHLVHAYFRSLKDNFRQANLMWALFLLAFALLFADLAIFRRMEHTAGTVLSVVVHAVLLFVFFTFLYTFPLQARFVNPVRTTLKNALFLSIYALPRTAGMSLIFLAGHFGAVLLLGAWYAPYLVLIGIAGPAYLNACLYVPVFRRLEED